jgi:hypothetical protein
LRPWIQGGTANPRERGADSPRVGEMYVACEAIQLCNDERGTVNSANAEGLSECGSIIPLTAFYLCELRHPLPVSAVQVRPNGLLLSFQPEAAHALLYR